MIEDTELLRRYAEEKSEAAFAELVQRQVNFVYACALRRVGGDAHLAKDVTQHVFTALARDAATLAQREVLSGWLFTTARNAAAQIVRGERRRQVRESEAQLMHELTSSSARDAEWEQLRPVLDDALDHLSDDDRQAVLLRFFEGKSFADVGAKLRLPENTARMRVERALDKMHAALAQRGVTSTTAALGVALANQVGVAAPVGLAASVTGAALAGTAASAGGWAAIFMSISKLQMGIAGAIALAGATGYVVQAQTNADLRREIAAIQPAPQTVAALRAENQQLAATVAEVELLRHDDVELKQLEQRATELKQASVEKARLAQVRTQDVRQQFYDRIRADDAKAQAEIDRMNRDGNALVEEFKALSAQAQDPTLTLEARAAADTAAKEKMEAIRRKKQETQAFVQNVRQSLNQRVQAFQQIYGNDPAVPPPQLQAGGGGRLESRRVSADGTNPANDSPPPNGERWFVTKP